MRDSEGDILESNTLGLVPAEGGSSNRKSINLLRACSDKKEEVATVPL